MANGKLRRLAKANGVPLWRIAEEMGISEPTMSRKMRNELTEAEAEKMREIIVRLGDGESE